jgi:DNA-binding response OmpR family regulator
LGATAFVEESLRWLPRTESSITATASPSQNRESRAAARILLADDNADMRDYVQRILSEEHEVVAVADGDAARAAARLHRPDLVLADVMMPGLDGFGLVTRLRTNAETQDIPIILLSARAGEEARVEGLAHGADDYLIEPFSARELLARVTGHVRLAQLANPRLRLSVAAMTSSNSVCRNARGTCATRRRNRRRISTMPCVSKR